ncbi:FG-GAP-like repeat-containing protein [Leptospira sp. 2 VSF19]|uniref:FG-GAP-like repeat-containing protein n=1 Tax=Leptospira soteropolitanensis TaxID=2950025 RepID=A0AAW5VJI2_9LEPT|nr:FG-GAP and VCBS repeat-containing protein [Leptospira soteropolitanensis]MCW7492813.1 FG-GAP-like repeat-containing protein [Leptospira soteropolitanensis]MCW7500048.1 FG-GAP-like repeat-containing protein [Leptospira soteropolitanensis]MCW7522299.1 FG-GAP-like repeat-containing protein [Leptospira soteropolitanensis]MCW7526155.1 FG-GAP-like repeat-containing protein [Leptospira soteropolitanensis]MCW7529733.1 FG-GAP-like repeat-containing protein [Leptospira soteropolitanensis]
MEIRSSNPLLNLKHLALGLSLFLFNCWANPLTHPSIECLMKLQNSLCPDKKILEKWSPYLFLTLLPESTVTISNLANHSIVETGFVVGTVASGHPYVNVWTDDILHTQVPVIDGTWRYALPARAVTNTFWTYGSLHTISVHLPFERPKTIQVRMGTNHDTNGDGYPDLIVSASPGAGSQGYAYVYQIDPTTKLLSQTPNTTLTDGQTNNTYFGSKISSGDYNGDGYADILVGSQAYGLYPGRVYLFLSSGQSRITSQNLTTANFTYISSVSDNFGSHSVVGDVNGNGYQDLVVGAPFYSSKLGQIYVFLSNFGNLSNIPQQNLPAPLDIASCPGVNACQFGTSIVLDYFNSDKCIDLAVGAPTFNTDQGIIFVYHSTCDPINPYNTPVATLKGPLTTSCYGNSCKFGGTLASGDTNGDGLPDLLIGATGASSGIGDVYLVLNDQISGYRNMDLSAGGSADSLFSGFATGTNFSQGLQFQDTNADGLQDIIISEPTTTNRVYTFHSVRGGAPTNQNLNNGGVTSQTLIPPAGTSFGNSFADLSRKAKIYLWALVEKTKEYFGMI